MNPVVTMGTFDGVHLGHQSIFDKLKKIAKEIDGETVVVTFEPHPRIVLKLDHENLRFLNTIEEKQKLFEKAGVDHLVLLRFTEEFSNLSSDDYIKKILVDKIQTKILVIGYDHHFGKDRKGDFEYLSKVGSRYGFEVEQVEAKEVERMAISSTKIRKALLEGDMKRASEFLGYHYSLSGKIVGGKGIGKTLGFPTANLDVDDSHKLIPHNGVYAVYVEYKNNTFKGMLSIGSKPTFNDEEENIEVNIFDFDEDIYDQQIKICIASRLRDIVKFDSVEALKDQLFQDMRASLELL